MNVNARTQRIESLLYYKMKPVLEIRIDYPHFTGKIPKKSENRINEYYRLNAKKQNAYARTQLYTQAVNNYRYAAKNGYEFNFYTLYNTFEPTFLSPGLISLYMDSSEYTGGAHPNTTRSAQTWDAQTGKRLHMRDFFKPSFPYQKFFIDYIIQEVESSENKEEYFDDTPRLIKKHFRERNFYLSPEGFVIFYPLYTIAPYYMGIQTFTIPYGQLNLSRP